MVISLRPGRAWMSAHDRWENEWGRTGGRGGGSYSRTAAGPGIYSARLKSDPSHAAGSGPSRCCTYIHWSEWLRVGLDVFTYFTVAVRMGCVQTNLDPLLNIYLIYTERGRPDTSQVPSPLTQSAVYRLVRHR